MDPQSLEIFVAAARSGTILGAAQACATSRGRVRRKLDELEAWAQTDLFLRERKGLSLTAAGELLLERVAPIVGELELVREYARRAGEAPSGVLKVAANALTPSFGVPEFFALCAQRMPDVKVEGTVCRDVTVKLQEGYEVGLLLAESVPPGPWTTFRAFGLHGGLFASPAYVERHGQPTTLAELTDHDLACWCYPGADGRSIPLRNGGRFDVEPRLAIDHGEPLAQLVRAGSVIGNFCPAPFGGNDLVPILADQVGYELSLFVLVARRAMVIPRVRELHRMLQVVGERVDASLRDRPS